MAVSSASNSVPYCKTTSSSFELTEGTTHSDASLPLPPSKK